MKETLLLQVLSTNEYVVNLNGAHANDQHIELCGANKPSNTIIQERKAIKFEGGAHGNSYIKLSPSILESVNDYSGLTVMCFVYLYPGQSVWERIIDFGAGAQGPYVFLTRNLRAVCFNGTDLAADYNKQLPVGEWFHVALTISGTNGGTESKAGPKLYLNGQLVVDGSISQTSSGTYLAYRQWLATLEGDAYKELYIGRSQFAADADFNGAISDLRVYCSALTDEQVAKMMCESLSDEQIIELAKQYEITLPSKVITQSIELPDALLGGLIPVQWSSSREDVLDAKGEINPTLAKAEAVTLSASIAKGDAKHTTMFDLTVVPNSIVPYEIKIVPEGRSVDVSPILYGLFYEDINNAADGGLYAEYVRNRSFEAFTYESFSHVCGEHGHSSGKIRNPLEGWYGDTDKVIVANEGGLNEHFEIEDIDVNQTYIIANKHTTLVNRGFNDSNDSCAMNFIEGQSYLFTIWAKTDQACQLIVQLQDSLGEPISEPISISLNADNKWDKYGVSQQIKLIARQTVLGQLAITFTGSAAIDMVSLFPEQVWGRTEEADSPTAHLNYLGNPNYRLRKDMVLALQQMKPRFLRFPGGCISEGSHVWENVYDWKHSVGNVETRKENFNVWGYMMTLGLGYMEYFQLAEDLNAIPLPVMACGVLCQARSDYANPAGGTLRDYYIKNFTDLIDFALSTDFEQNEWAALRAQMGHAAPFDLRYLGVGNENWGTEFFANFEVFKVAIDRYMQAHYPGHPLTIISTVGAQADDDAFQQGWKFLRGKYEGSEQIAFTDGKNRIVETVNWYSEQEHYMDTIADEHYYRSNDYLLRNADRYNYYFRAYDENGKLDEQLTSKVFVGEYASNDKNTLAGAIAEAAIMTGFERNADVVRLAAYAPLFNKVLTDGSYRWTPDCIWFDDSDIWFTPNYYVQKLFASYIGERTLSSKFYTYRQGERTLLSPSGGVSLTTHLAEVILKSITIRDSSSNNILFEQDFTQTLHNNWKWIDGSDLSLWQQGIGVVLKPNGHARVGLYLEENWSNIKVEVNAYHVTNADGLYIGVGVENANSSKRNAIEYIAGYEGKSTGIKVFKQGVEAYTLGDFASSTMAGNLRAAYDECLEEQTSYHYRIEYGGNTGDQLIVSHSKGADQASLFDATYQLEAYNDEIFYSITEDADGVYMKLVNAASLSKDVLVDLSDLAISEQFEVHILTGDASLLNVPNVNKKNEELIQPYQLTGKLQGHQAKIQLPAHSVAVAVWKRAKMT